ncbi:tetratricopeptide repeat protein [Geobacillus zalihae]|uniref:tetratricopeptide repeat protein n=1 Tax=Geobacillus zalihae TaxID=213419 RepID=UPI0016801F8C|nr:tetratricopeptide repeat protein [Geobacillus zalihae]QNU25066.1 hypothetical protein IC806_01735 [Geobacillus zalihae]
MTKTKKRKLHNIQEVEETFFKGIEYLQKERYPKAIKLFERVVDFGDSPYFSGAYVNLAVAYMEQNPLDQNNLKIAKMYLKKALEIKPNNLAAKSIAVQLHVALKDFKTAINYFLDLEDSTLINGNLYFLEVMEPLAIKGDKAIIEAIPELEKLYKTYKSKWPKVINILGHAYLANQEYQKSFSAFKEYLYLYKNQPISIFTLANLSMICSTYLRNPKEGLEYAQEGLKLFKKQSQHFQTKNTNVQNILTSNLALAYSALKDYEQVVKILEPKLKTYPNNTDFHNIGFAYFKLGKYKEALENINKALFISTDETSLFVKAEIYYYQKEYEKAITYYKKH